MLFFLVFLHVCMPRSSHLQAHGGWDQRSLGHPPTRRAKAPSGPAAGFSATHLVYRPSGSDWSCIGWGPPPLPGRGSVQRWDPATRTSSIWSRSSQPARQGRETVSVQSRCFRIYSAPLRKHVLSRVLRVGINPLLWSISPLTIPTPHAVKIGKEKKKKKELFFVTDAKQK